VEDASVADVAAASAPSDTSDAEEVWEGDSADTPPDTELDAAPDDALNVPPDGDAEPDLPIASALEDCTHGIDEDLDGDVDELDLDCMDLGACEVPAALCEAGDWSCQAAGEGADCLTGGDDDGNGLIDCLDLDCALDPACSPTPCVPGECEEGFVCDIWPCRCLDTRPDPVLDALIGEPCAVEEDCQTSGHSRAAQFPTCNMD
jgi:hypothetical protein